MDGFEAYKLFVAIRNHFTTDSYDFFKYQGKTNCTYAAYTKRKDKYLFDKLARLPNPQPRIVASLVESIDWINDVVGQKGYDAFIKHQKYVEAIQYTFKEQLKDLPHPVGVLVNCGSGCPKLAQLYFQNKVSLETVVLINNLVDFTSIWEVHSADPLIQKLVTKIKKYTPFLSVDMKKIQQIFVDFYVNKA